MANPSIIEAVHTCMRSAFAKGESCVLPYFHTMERGSTLQVQTKSDDSPMTCADIETEAALRTEINNSFPEDSILGEEMGMTHGENTKQLKIKNAKAAMWVIDPIDGTKAFIAGYPLFGILLARIDEDGSLQASGVSMPALGCRRFFAAQNAEVWEEDAKGNKLRQLQTSHCENLTQARIVIGEAERTLQGEPEVVRALTSEVASVRYEHDCYMYVRLAAGGIDLLLESGLQAYDFMPLVLIVERAGGVISDWHGEPLTIKSQGYVLASASQNLHKQALAQIHKIY